MHVRILCVESFDKKRLQDERGKPLLLCTTMLAEELEQPSTTVCPNPVIPRSKYTTKPAVDSLRRFEKIPWASSIPIKKAVR